MDVMRMMCIGAMEIAAYGKEHTPAHAAVGFSAEEWDLLTTPTPWTPEQRRQVRSVLAEAVSVTLTLAGLPSEPLPGQYVAAVIAQLVAPANRLVAAYRAPECFDAISASGLIAATEVRPMGPEQMVSLVVAYSSGVFTDVSTRWPRAIEDEVLRRDKEA